MILKFLPAPECKVLSIDPKTGEMFIILSQYNSTKEVGNLSVTEGTTVEEHAKNPESNRKILIVTPRGIIKAV